MSCTMSSQRGVELSLNLVILIVIGLIVVALVIYLVVRTISGGNTDLSGCTSKGGHCEPKGGCGQGESESSLFNGGCANDYVCCLSQQGFTGGK